MKLDIITLFLVIVFSVSNSEAQGFFGSHSSIQSNFQNSEAFSLPTSRKRNSNPNFKRQEGAPPSIQNSFQQHYTPSNLIRNPAFTQLNNQPFHSNFQSGFAPKSPPIRYTNQFSQSSTSNRPKSQFSQDNHRFSSSTFHQQPQLPPKQFNPISFTNNRNRSQVIATRSPIQRNQNKVVTYVQPGLQGKGSIQNSHRVQSHTQQSNEKIQNHHSTDIRTVPLNTHGKSLVSTLKSPIAKALPNEGFKNPSRKISSTSVTNQFNPNFHRSKNVDNKVTESSLNRFSDHESSTDKTKENGRNIVKQIQPSIDTINKRTNSLQSKENSNSRQISGKETLVMNGSKSKINNLNLESLLRKGTEQTQFRDTINEKKVDSYPGVQPLKSNASLLLSIQKPKNLFHSSSNEGYSYVKTELNRESSNPILIHEKQKTLEIVSYPSKSEVKESSIEKDSDLKSSSKTKKPAFEVNPDEYKAFMEWVNKNRHKMGPGATTTTTRTYALSSSTLQSLPPSKLTSFLPSISTDRPQTTSSTTYLTTLSTTISTFINTTPSSSFRTILLNSSPSRVSEFTTTTASTSTVVTTVKPPLNLSSTTKSSFRPKFRNFKRIRNYNAKFRPKPMSYFQRYREQKLSTKKISSNDLETKVGDIASTTLKPKYFVLNKSKRVRKWRPGGKDLSKLRIHKNRESQTGKRENVVKLLSSSARKPFSFKGFPKIPPSSVIVDIQNNSASNASSTSPSLNATATSIDVTISMEGNDTSSTTIVINSTTPSFEESTTVTSIIDDHTDSSTFVPSLSDTSSLPSTFEVTDILSENGMNEPITSTSLNPKFTIETTTTSGRETLKMTDNDSDTSTAHENIDVSERTLVNTSKVANISRILPTPLPYILSNANKNVSSFDSEEDEIPSTIAHITPMDDKTSTTVFPQHIRSNSSVTSDPNLESPSYATINSVQESDRRSDTVNSLPAFLKDAIPMKDAFNLTDVKVISHRNMNFSGGYAKSVIY